MNALARIQEIQSQMHAMQTALRPGDFGAHLRAATTPPVDRGPAVMAASARPATDPLTEMRAFPIMDDSGRSATALLETRRSTMEVPDGVELPERASRWLGEIEAAANRHGLPPTLLTALVWSESAFVPDAESHAGAIGLAQLMPGTAAMMNVDPYDPIQNLEGGARYLAAQLDRFESVDLALAAYNAGPGRVQRAGGIPDITETRNYVAIVTRRYHQLEGIDA